MAACEGHGEKEKRRVARALVATYHEAELAGLVEHVAEAIESYRAGELDVHDVDEVIHRYHKATRSAGVRSGFADRAVNAPLDRHGLDRMLRSAGHLRLGLGPEAGLFRALRRQIGYFVCVDVEYNLTLARLGVLDCHRRRVLLVNRPTGQVADEDFGLR
jgi:hypothetical protein